jgi:hypothetical protein
MAPRRTRATKNRFVLEFGGRFCGGARAESGRAQDPQTRADAAAFPPRRRNPMRIKSDGVFHAEHWREMDVYYPMNESIEKSPVVFISYSHSDSRVADSITEVLEGLAERDFCLEIAGYKPAPRSG